LEAKRKNDDFESVRNQKETDTIIIGIKDEISKYNDEIFKEAETSVSLVVAVLALVVSIVK